MKTFFLKKKKYLLALVDIIFIFLIFQFIIRYARGVSVFDFDTIGTNTKILNIIVYILFLFLFQSYKFIWAYAGVREYFLSSVACIASIIVVSIVSVLVPNTFLDVKYSILANAFIILILIGFRTFLRVTFMVYHMHLNSVAKYKKNLLVIGAGAGGNIIIRDFQKDPNSKYNIVGIIDDKIEVKGYLVSGVKVLGNRNDILSICKEKNIDEILLAIPSISVKDKTAILNICSNTACKIKVLPNIKEIIDINKLKSSVRDVEVEDLLEREPIKLNSPKIYEYILGKTILVTGGGGSIGSELCRQIAKYEPKKLVVLDIYENNAYDIENELRCCFPNLSLEIVIASVRDKDRLNNIFQQYRPNIVFHAAAHKHVPLMESNPSEAIKNNVFGTINTAKYASKYKVEKFVLISSDKAVNPTNVMGAKR